MTTGEWPTFPPDGTRQAGADGVPPVPTRGRGDAFTPYAQLMPTCDRDNGNVASRRCGRRASSSAASRVYAIRMVCPICPYVRSVRKFGPVRTYDTSGARRAAGGG